MKLRIIDPLSIMGVIWVLSLVLFSQRTPTEPKQVVVKPCAETYRIETSTMSKNYQRYDTIIFGEVNGQ